MAVELVVKVVLKQILRLLRRLRHDLHVRRSLFGERAVELPVFAVNRLRVQRGNPNPDYENLRLVTFDSLLSFGNMLRVANRYTMRIYCKKWNDIVRKTKVSGRERLFVHPERAEFALTIPFDGRRR